MEFYIGKKGETPASVAQKLGVSEAVLTNNNDLSGVRFPAEGQPYVVVRNPVIHTVTEGETVGSVAALYGIEPNDIYRNNLLLRGDSRIFPGQTLAITVERQPLGEFETGGYAYPFISRELLDTNLPFMGALMPFTYGFRTDGTLISPDDGEMLRRCREYGTSPVMHLSTLTEGDVFSVELAETLLGNSELQNLLIDNIVANMQEKGYESLDVDFEFLGKENAQAYGNFVALCRDRLNPLGYGVMAALAPKTSDTQQGALYEGHDYRLLGESANAVLLMTYEWGYTYGPPMAVSPILPVENVVRYATERIEPKKIFLGISNYGYDFVLPYIQGVSQARSLSTREAFLLAAERNAEIVFDEKSQAPYFEYYEGENRHIVWFEDGRSIASRLELMAKYGLKGALYWNLNRPNNQNLVVINGLINPKKFELL